MPDLDPLKSIAEVAAPAGLAIGAFLYFARDVIAKEIFPKLTIERAYHVIIFLALMAWTIALSGIGAWVYVEIHKEKAPQKLEPKIEPKINVETLLPPHRRLGDIYQNMFKKPNRFCDAEDGQKPVTNAGVYLSPERIYFPAEYSKENDRHYPILKLDNESQLILKNSINWISKFNTSVCAVIIVGATDGEGTREFNLGVGQLTAVFVKQKLVKAGFNDNHIETVSLGEEIANETFTGSIKSNISKDYNNFADILVIINKDKFLYGI